MIIKNGASSVDISRACENIKANHPHLKEIITFYERLFLLQEDSFNNLAMDPVDLSEELVKKKLDHQFPLIGNDEFTVDYNAGRTLFKAIGGLCMEFKINDHEAIGSIMTALNKGASNSISFKQLAGFYLSRDKTKLGGFSKTWSIGINNLDFLLYNALKPSIVKCSGELAHHLHRADTKKQGYCPVCGSLPGLALLNQNGSRMLVCSYCWHQWETQRILCPFCSSTDSKRLSYVKMEEEKSIRGDVCDLCKKYIKTIDTRECEEKIYLPLELLAGLPLDMKLSQEGYESGSTIEEGYHQG